MLRLHGKPRTPTWTNLAQTANVGANQITLKEAVDWENGEEIVIASTSFKYVYKTFSFFFFPYLMYPYPHADFHKIGTRIGYELGDTRVKSAG